eukprot:gnl/TRDRNA2_/TRDRNA2_179952_c0_seq1.p1 gnl/TRDRNA2_/TRDRNA2_179952_c0~~gnl/TRDRNA2_/TRDRNA2_179952_c0_seq1.p1  ORF type:complete len:540 (+),score=88.98 gnl/TRDRNA2_/TRDRNA2_179952_c0_seq1:73-1620(+)
MASYASCVVSHILLLAATTAALRVSSRSAQPGPPNAWITSQDDDHRLSDTHDVLDDDDDDELKESPQRAHRRMLGGPHFDEQKNIYIATEDSIRKFTPARQVSWTYRSASGPLLGSPSLLDHKLYGSTRDGHVFALDLDTGEELWSEKQAESVEQDTPYVQANNGVVVTGVDRSTEGGNTQVIGLNATDGHKLWSFKPEASVANVMALFPDEESTMFMDYTGGVYRLGLKTGELLWHTPAASSISLPISELDPSGGMALGHQGDVYVCSNPDRGVGALRKLRVSDGHPLWDVDLPQPCNSWPVVSNDDDTLVVLQKNVTEKLPRMSFVNQPHETDNLRTYRLVPTIAMPEESHAELVAFSTEDGQVLWHHELPPLPHPRQTADEEDGFANDDNVPPWCRPSDWEAPTVGENGTIQVGRPNGDMYQYNPSQNTSSQSRIQLRLQQRKQVNDDLPVAPGSEMPVAPGAEMMMDEICAPNPQGGLPELPPETPGKKDDWKKWIKWVLAWGGWLAWLTG